MSFLQPEKFCLYLFCKYLTSGSDLHTHTHTISWGGKKMFENTGGQYFLPVKYCTVEFSMGGPEPSAEVPSATVDDKKKQRLWGDQAAWNSDKGRKNRLLGDP